MTPGELEAAIEATDAFARTLRAEGLLAWAARFDAIATCLRRGEHAAALRAFRHTAYTGPGSLSDVFANDQAAFDRAWSACSRALRALGEHSRT